MLFSQKVVWYPPAETKIPWRAIFSGFTGQPGEFKDDLRCYLKVDHCLLGESARALLYKLLETLKEQDTGQRDEVLIPGYSCYSVAAAVAKAGLKIAVYDLDPATFYPDMDSFESAISKNTLAVITQHLFGMLTPITEVKKITHRYNAYLIEDAAQAFGNGDAETVAGTTGDFGLFSFGRGKPLPVGGGGALVSRSHHEVFDKIRFDRPKNGFRQAVVSAVIQVASRPALYWIPELLPIGLGQTVFDPDFKVEAMPNTINIISRSALPHLKLLNGHRKRLSGVYCEHLANKYRIKNSENATSMIRFPVMLPSTTPVTKDLSRLGVRRMYPKAIVEENAIRQHLKQEQVQTPGAAEISKKLLTLPTHMGINQNTVRRICIEINKFAKGR